MLRRFPKIRNGSCNFFPFSREMHAPDIQGSGASLQSMLFFLNIIYLAQNLAINKSQQQPANPNQDHVLAPTQFLVLNLYF